MALGSKNQEFFFPGEFACSSCGAVNTEECVTPLPGGEIRRWCRTCGYKEIGVPDSFGQIGEPMVRQAEDGFFRRPGG